MRGGHHHQLLRSEAKGIEAGAVRHAAFGERHILRDPEQTRRGSSTPRHCQSKPGRYGKMRLASCRDFMERAPGEASAEHRIDGGNAEGQGAGAAFDPRRLLQGLQALAELVDHP